MGSWDGQLNGAIAAAGSVIKGVVSAAEADALQRQVNTLKDAAQLRADDVVIFLLEQLYGSGFFDRSNRFRIATCRSRNSAAPPHPPPTPHSRPRRLRCSN